MPKVDYSAIQEQDFTPVEDGVYAARLSGFELVEPKEADKFPYYNCEYTAAEEAQIGNRKFWKINSLNPKALWAFKKDMLSLGANPEDMAPGSEVDTDDIIREVLDTPCRLVLKKETYPKRDGSGMGEKSSIVEVLPALPF